MAYFAKINENNIVVRVQPLQDEWESIGEQKLNEIFRTTNDRWIQTSYNGNIRANYAGIGYIYDEVNDVFYAPQLFKSWVLNNKWQWESPIPYPEDGNEYTWDEDTLSWIQINN